MKARRWIWLIGLLMVAVITGCTGQRSERPDVDFVALALEASPAEIQHYYAEMKALPGFFVLQKDGQTYLLLMAGAGTEADSAVRVTDIRKMERQWRLLAVLEPGAAKGATYPYAVVQLKAPLDTPFIARLTTPEGEVLELKGMHISDR